MILLSARELDLKFLASAIRDQRLDPRPIEGFHAQPDYWCESERYRRVVERYRWGAVVLLSDYERGQHATLVLTGPFDLERGTATTTPGHNGPIPVSWYPELAAALARSTKQATRAIPPCLGFHENDHVCDGGTDPESGRIEEACAWRDRCLALQAHAIERNVFQEDVLRGRSPDEIVVLTAELLRKKPEPKTIEDQPVRSITDRASLLAATREYIRSIAAQAGACIASDERAAKRDDLFILDRTGSSDYLSLHQVESTRKRKPIALFRLRPSVNAFHVHLPLKPTHPWLTSIARSDVMPWKLGVWHACVYRVEPGEHRADLIRDLIVKLIGAKAGAYA